MHRGMSVDSLTLRPIGYIRVAKPQKFDARHQPDESAPERNTLELVPGHNYEQALADVAGFSRVWLIWWFHRNTTWKTQILPPRGPEVKRGLFATRSPHRPNPIGMTPVQLLGVSGRTLTLGPCDLVDGTPVFDIKPYVPAYDAFPGERAGWIDEVDAHHAEPPPFTVTLSPRAEEQAAWLASVRGADLRPRLIELLSRDPSPHRTRRIRKCGRGGFDIGLGGWRGYFTVEDHTVTVTDLGPGYPLSFLNDPARPHILEREQQLAFHARWPESAPPLARPARPPRSTHWNDPA